MPVQPPTLEELVDIAEGYGLSLTDADDATVLRVADAFQREIFDAPRSPAV